MKHLRTRVLIQILIPTLAVFLIITISSYLFYIDKYKDSVIEKKQAEFLNVSRLFSDWISGRIRELMLIATSSQIESENNIQARNYLNSEQSRGALNFTALWLINNTGQFWNTGGKTGFLPDSRDTELVFSKDKLFLYFVTQNQQTGSSNPFILFGVPVVRNGKVIRILAGSIDTSELDWLLNLYTYKMFDSAAIIDMNTSEFHTSGGIVIAHSDAGLYGRSELELYGGDISSNKYMKSESFFVTSLINNWKFTGRIKNTNLYYQIDVLSRFFILILVLLIIVISVLSIGISMLIARPIVSLTHMTNQMLHGDFNNAISVRTKDELNSLANAFNLLNKRNIQLRTNDRFSFLGRISSRMAHEIRHPLHVIQIAVQTLSRDNFPKNRDIIFQEIRKAEMFIREILEIAKPNDLSLKYYSMSKLVENICRKYRLLEEEDGINLIMSLDAEYDSFYFDVLKIEQVLTNIINNSFEVTPQGGKITVSVGNSIENSVTVTITDTGPGFDLKSLDRVFDPYFTTKKNGTGLGLSICYQILTAHGANIELYNSPAGGAGTRIVFSSLPDR